MKLADQEKAMTKQQKQIYELGEKEREKKLKEEQEKHIRAKTTTVGDIIRSKISEREKEAEDASIKMRIRDILKDKYKKSQTEVINTEIKNIQLMDLSKLFGLDKIQTSLDMNYSKIMEFQNKIKTNETEINESVTTYMGQLTNLKKLFINQKITNMQEEEYKNLLIEMYGYFIVKYANSQWHYFRRKLKNGLTDDDRDKIGELVEWHKKEIEMLSGRIKFLRGQELYYLRKEHLYNLQILLKMQQQILENIKDQVISSKKKKLTDDDETFIFTLASVMTERLKPMETTDIELIIKWKQNKINIYITYFVEKINSIEKNTELLNENKDNLTNVLGAFKFYFIKFYHEFIINTASKINLHNITVSENIIIYEHNEFLINKYKNGLDMLFTKMDKLENKDALNAQEIFYLASLFNIYQILTFNQLHYELEINSKNVEKFEKISKHVPQPYLKQTIIEETEKAKKEFEASVTMYIKKLEFLIKQQIKLNQIKNMSGLIELSNIIAKEKIYIDVNIYITIAEQLKYLSSNYELILKSIESKTKPTGGNGNGTQLIDDIVASFKQIKPTRAQIDALLNPSYISPDIKQHLDPTDKLSTDQFGGAKKIISLPFLYDSRNLINPDTPVNDLITNLIEISPNPSSNPGRIQLLTILYYLITNQTSISAIDKSKLKTNIEDALYGYQTVLPRLSHIPTSDFQKNLKQFRDAFVMSFAQALPVPTQTTTTKTLATDSIKKFYRNFISTNVPLYERFFDIIEISTGTPVDLATSIPDSDLKKYRLIIRKTPYLTKIQKGGNGNDNAFILFIPMTPVSSNFIWLSRQKWIPAINFGGQDALRNIVRVTTRTIGPVVTILNIPLQIPVIIHHATTNPFHVDYANVFDIDPESTLPQFTSVWKSGEMELAKHLTKHAEQWTRQGDLFSRHDKITVDNCQLIQKSTDECLNLLTGCINAPNDKFPETCQGFLSTSFNFSSNTSMTELAEKVSKMDPSIAYKILEKFGFGYYRDETTKLLRVEGVGTWLEELLKRPNKCTLETCSSLRNYLGPKITETMIEMVYDKSKWQLFDYLGILVDWVNANPRVLQVEIVQPEPEKSQPIDPDFIIYDHIGPSRKIANRLKHVSCGLERLKSSIYNDLAGARKPIISPVKIDMPLARLGFTYPGYSSMHGGGGIFDMEHELQKIGSQNGYELLKSLYQDLLNIIANLSNNKICLSDHSKMKIDNRLQQFQEIESDYRKALVNYVQRPYTDNKLVQYTDFLELNNIYNRKATEIIDIFQAIIKTVLDKLRY